MIKFGLVFLGGGIGSMLRYAVSGFFLSSQMKFPLGTFAANLISSFILGLLLGVHLSSELSENQKILFLVGLCGGFSTFSTFSYESLQMLKNGDYMLSIAYVATSIIFSFAAIALGIRIMQ